MLYFTLLMAATIDFLREDICMCGKAYAFSLLDLTSL